MLRYDTTLYGRLSIDNVQRLRPHFRYRDQPRRRFNGRGASGPSRSWTGTETTTSTCGDSCRCTRARRSTAMRGQIGWQLWTGARPGAVRQLYAVRPTVRIRAAVDAGGAGGVTPGDESIVDFDSSGPRTRAKTKRAFFGGLLRYTTAVDVSLRDVYRTSGATAGSLRHRCAVTITRGVLRIWILGGPRRRLAVLGRRCTNGDEPSVTCGASVGQSGASAGVAARRHVSPA
jgi:hypothetical protein